MKICSGRVVHDVWTLTEEYSDVPDILNRWRNEKEEAVRSRTDKSFYVPVDEIRSNNYNLSFNEYRKIAKEVQPYVPHQTPVISKKGANDNTTVEIARWAAIVAKLPALRAGLKKRSPVILVSVCVICLVAIAFYFMFSKNNPPAAIAARDTVTAGKPVRGQLTQKQMPKTSNAGMLSAEHIKATLHDTTTGITYFQKQTDTPSPGLTKAGIMPGSSPAGNALQIRYTVTDTTYFHDQPDESTRRKSYLDPLNKNILNPLSDSNGYIYIVYTNRFGRTSKGWINKKDLKPLQQKRIER